MAVAKFSLHTIRINTLILSLAVVMVMVMVIILFLAGNSLNGH